MRKAGKYKSDAFEAIHSAASGMHRAGTIGKATMLAFDHSCLARPLTKQERERRYFEQFKSLHDIPGGKIKYADKPDVIITGTRRLGIEITNFYVQKGNLTSAEQVQARWRESVVSDAQRLYLQSGGKNVEFNFGFDKMHPITNKEVLAEEIARFARVVDSYSTGQIPKDQYRHLKELSFMYLLSGDSVLSEPTALAKKIYEPLGFPARWRVTQVHSFDLMSIERLQMIVSEKEAKISQYSRCDAYWLLVVVDFIDAAQEQEIRLDDVSLNSDLFEQIIVYKPNFEHVLRVVPQRSTANHERETRGIHSTLIA